MGGWLFLIISACAADEFGEVLVEFYEHFIINIGVIAMVVLTSHLIIIVVVIVVGIVLTPAYTIAIITTIGIMYCPIGTSIRVHILDLVHRLLFLVLLVADNRRRYFLNNYLLLPILLPPIKCLCNNWLLSLCYCAGRTVIN